MTVPSRMPTHELDECVCGHTAGEHSATPPHACVVGVRNPEEYGECKGGACSSWRSAAAVLVTKRRSRVGNSQRNRTEINHHE
jgi:hypothetical protein